MTCESVSAALAEGRLPTAAEASHSATCAACQRLENSLRTPPAPLRPEAPAPPTAAGLHRAVRRA
jgi:hypothetical protein